MFSEGEMTQGRMESTRRSGPHIEKVLEKLLRALSMWVIPLAIALFSLLALSAWDDRYSSEPLQQLEFQALLDESGELTAKEALARLANEKNRSNTKPGFPKRRCGFGSRLIHRSPEPTGSKFPPVT